MATGAELMTAMETRISLARGRAGLLRVQADLLPAGDPAADKLHQEADEVDSSALAWSLAAECLREAIRRNAETEAMLMGWPVKVERPSLKVVRGEDDAA
jgi:hypothetical protein